MADTTAISWTDYNWSPWTGCARISDAFPLPLIPCRGQLSFFHLEPEVNQLVAEAIRQRTAMPANQTRGGE